MADDPWADPPPASIPTTTLPAPTPFGSDEPGWGAAPSPAPADETFSDAPAEAEAAPAEQAQAAPAKEEEDDEFHAAADELQDDFGDFDDDDDDGVAGVQGDDDDFGDFGDFDAAPPIQPEAAAPVVQAPVVQAQSSGTAQWTPLQVSLDSTSASLADQIRTLLAPALPGEQTAYPYHDGAAANLGNERVREGVKVRGEGSQNMWATLSSQPTLRPTDYQRSYTRRSHLIALGVPINLEEFAAPAVRARVMPPLSLTLDGVKPTAGPLSAPGGASRASADGRLASKPGSRAASPAPARNERLAERRREELGLGVPPEVDMARAQELVDLTEDHLTLQSLPHLRALSAELSALTVSTSLLLTHHLTLREAHAADAEMYNGLIRDLVAGAATRFGPGGSGGAAAKDRRHTSMGSIPAAGAGRKPSQLARNASLAVNGSGRNSPASPGDTSSPRR